jgi:hypothetical protein
LIFQPDTTSGGEPPAEQQAGHLAMPTGRTNSNEDQSAKSKIS